MATEQQQAEQAAMASIVPPRPFIEQPQRLRVECDYLDDSFL